MEPTKKLFTTDIPGEGAFTFKHRTMRLEMAIGAKFSKYTEGVTELNPWFASIANVQSTLETLIESAPEGWDIATMDPLDDNSYSRLIVVYNALRERESFFRAGATKGSEAPGPGNGRHDGILVSQTVQPAAQSSALP